MVRRTYSEAIQYAEFLDRFEYLALKGSVGRSTFGFDRYLNQRFYKSHEWLTLRNHIIARDDGNDLGVSGYPIDGRILVHHINPIDIDSLTSFDDALLNPDNLICVSHRTHNAIHYGTAELLPKPPVERSPNDTKLW